MASVSISTVQPEQIISFLNKLGTDDEFRASVESNPTKALTSYGISIEGLPATITLPPKEKIVSALDSAGASGTVGTAAVHIAFLAFFAFMV